MYDGITCNDGNMYPLAMEPTSILALYDYSPAGGFYISATVEFWFNPSENHVMKD